MHLKRSFFLLGLVAVSAGLPALKQDEEISKFFTHPEARLVGGTLAAEGSHPHMVAITTGTAVQSFLCGASLITSRRVLTAAHCINAVYNNNMLMTSVRVRVGSNQWNSGGRSYAVSRNITHPNYVRWGIKNDLGFFVPTSNIVMSPTIRAISISFDWVGPGVQARVAGWGRIIQNGEFSENLLELTTSTVDGEQCARAVADMSEDMFMIPPVEPHIELCALHSAGHGNCHGDSGSPLVRTDSRQQVGIVSWGLPCARGAPDVFVRLSAFRIWIQNQL